MRFDKGNENYGMRVIFTLSDDYSDIFEFDEGADSGQIVQMINQGIPPESLMIWIRDSMNVTVH